MSSRKGHPDPTRSGRTRPWLLSSLLATAVDPVAQGSEGGVALEVGPCLAIEALAELRRMSEVGAIDKAEVVTALGYDDVLRASEHGHGPESE